MDNRCCEQDFDGSHYHCAHCGQVSSMQGHYMSEDIGKGFEICINTKRDTTRTNDGRILTMGFCCPKGHTCKDRK